MLFYLTWNLHKAGIAMTRCVMAIPEAFQAI